MFGKGPAVRGLFLCASVAERIADTHGRADQAKDRAHRVDRAFGGEHQINPRDLVPESIMPGYPFLAENEVRSHDIADHLRANRAVGVPYTDEMIEMAVVDLKAQADPDSDGADAVAERYPGTNVRNFDNQGGDPTELDALIAYLQVLGTMVDFSAYDAEANYR